jgi:non-heme chloroperoxidase
MHSYAQTDPSWRDASEHQVRFVTVEDGVKLEVLDWGGNGRPVVLLAALGNTAHIFDNFAEKLSRTCHVYGITRRGFGQSSRPDFGYADQRLSDDVLHVLDSLNLAAPILIGHSIAGDELTTLGAQLSDRLGGLVYLDAAADPTETSSPEYDELLKSLPAVMRTPGLPSPADFKTLEAYWDWQIRTVGYAFPDAELHQSFKLNTDGSIAVHVTPKSVFDAIRAGARKRDYSQIRVPILAYTWYPLPVEVQMRQFQLTKAVDRVAVEKVYEAQASITDARIKAVQSAASGTRVVTIPGADHYVFLSSEKEVLRELVTFVAGLN